MLFLVSQIDHDRYAIPVDRIVEVLPLVSTSRLRLAHSNVAGVMRYRGESVVVIDLSHVLCGVAAPSRFSTRIVMLGLKIGNGGDALVGLIAERATSVVVIDERKFHNPGGSDPAQSILGLVAFDQIGAIRRMNIDALASFLEA